MDIRIAPSLATAPQPDIAAAGAAHAVVVFSDDSPAAASWVGALAAEGYAARCVAIDACAGAREPPPDAWVLHLTRGLPAQLARLRELRAATPRTPLVTVCTALRDLDHVLALEMGADDVLDAALPAPVVAARLRALWRRCAAIGATPAQPPQLAFGTLQLQRDERKVLLRQRAVPLTDGEFELLWLLALRAGQAVPRADLVRRLRGLDYERDDRSVDCRVYRIRAKLGDCDAQARRIRTVRNCGYLFSPLPW